MDYIGLGVTFVVANLVSTIVTNVLDKYGDTYSSGIDFSKEDTQLRRFVRRYITGSEL